MSEMDELVGLVTANPGLRLEIEANRRGMLRVAVWRGRERYAVALGVSSRGDFELCVGDCLRELRGKL